jgi:hypothetical protein
VIKRFGQALNGLGSLRRQALTRPVWRQHTNTPYYASQPYAGSAIGRNRTETKLYGGLGQDSTNHNASWYEYDIALNTWTAKASASAYHASASCISDGDYIWVFGGTAFGVSATLAVSRYDIINNTWSTAITTMPTYRENCQMAKISATKWLLPGGYNRSTGAYEPAVYIYDPALNTWTAKTSHPAATPGFVFMVGTGDLDTAVHAHYYNAGGSAFVNSGYRYNLAANTWTGIGSASAGLANGGGGWSCPESIDGIGLHWGTNGANSDWFEWDQLRVPNSSASTGGTLDSGGWMSTGAGASGKLNNAIVNAQGRFWTHTRDQSFWSYQPRGNRKGIIERLMAAI